MSVLVPIISKNENNSEFLDKVIKGQRKVFLLAIMDTNAAAKNFGFATSEIGHGNELIEQIKKYLEEKEVRVNETLLWGDTNHQIVNFVQLKNIRKVALIRQENKYFSDLVKELKEHEIKVLIF